ncbi:ubiquitin- hect domain protein, putative [Ichthyophthirius multifiliis]|uniref:HECT-type E3 ubiquitin transferase n=1 Tax=Ichthyophthirius multifiliis TaxID=5932 RepID=G0R437_ICHMU|nr:ubiquitin- hect domain protein, putative [Ichthyophthirius multifiliis]EGR27757.1 ubiquitin- hect domain protein, putative [Ichthyophthirius multifiliis]|eukprot:XP_004025209.1 ubiquitin- hect domain protein, putative [Ichthyophthirius multifiliis]
MKSNQQTRTLFTQISQQINPEDPLRHYLQQKFPQDFKKKQKNKQKKQTKKNDELENKIKEYDTEEDEEHKNKAKDDFFEEEKADEEEDEEDEEEEEEEEEEKNQKAKNEQESEFDLFSLSSSEEDQNSSEDSQEDEVYDEETYTEDENSFEEDETIYTDEYGSEEDEEEEEEEVEEELMYSLHPYYDFENYQNKTAKKTPTATSFTDIPQININKQASIQQNIIENIQFYQQKNTLFDLPTLINILESGFCDLIKLFVGLSDQLFQKYIRVVQKNPQILHHLDLETRILAISIKAIRRAKKRSEKKDFYLENINLKINRKCVFENSFQKILTQTANQIIQKQFEVKFKNEEGIDQSGLTKEWYSCIVKEIFNPNNALFKLGQKKLMHFPNPLSYLVPDNITIFKFTGIIIAKAILNRYIVGIDFAKFFLKVLTHRNLKISDLEDIEPQQAQNLLWIKENSVDDLYLTFTYNYYVFDDYKEVELIKNGKNIEVTNQNKNSYIEKVLYFIMIQQIKDQIRAFMDGFYSIFPKSELYLIDWMELGMQIAGNQEINFQEMRINTQYSGGYNEQSEQIKWFWEIVDQFDDKMKRNFLFFLSGSYKLPLGGFKEFGFEIKQIFDIQNLPVAHTCFNQLDLPQYESKNILLKKLLQAILEGNDSFGIE